MRDGPRSPHGIPECQSSSSLNAPVAPMAERFLQSLRRRNASENTVLSYGKDLALFAEHFVAGG